MAKKRKKKREMLPFGIPQDYGIFGKETGMPTPKMEIEKGSPIEVAIGLYKKGQKEVAPKVQEAVRKIRYKRTAKQRGRRRFTKVMKQEERRKARKLGKELDIRYI